MSATNKIIFNINKSAAIINHLKLNDERVNILFSINQLGIICLKLISIQTITECKTNSENLQ